jgi:photosynthetic reaction center H subunit
MEIGALTQHMDVAQVTLYVFWIFFAILLFYLRMEDRREGYPLEADQSGEYSKDPWLFVPTPKTFHLPHGHGTVMVPNATRDNESRPIPGAKIAEFSGAPYQPTGDNPMVDSIGPGSWAERANVPDIAHGGEPKIVPMSVAKDYFIAEGDTDPRGLRIVGFDSIVGGTIRDVWVDRSEQLIRFLEIDTDGENSRRVLVPMNFGVFRKTLHGERIFYVHAIAGGHFSNVPGTAKKTQVTLLEEDKIMAYYGSGLLYGHPGRQESII